MKNIVLLLLVCLVFSCKNTNNENAAESQTAVPEKTAPAKKYRLTDFSESPSFPDAKIENVGYSDGKFNFGISSETYELGSQTSDAPQKMCANSGKGQHIHLIVDDLPYAAKYVSSFEHEVADGVHYMLAFLSRSYHESIKTDIAHVAYVVDVKDNTFKNAANIETPMLFYSRPKGTYVGKANTGKVMLDFYMVNAVLGGAEGYKVQVDINGEQTEVIEEWKPYFIEGLPMGENTVKLTLLDKTGSPANTPLNPVERKFTLKEDPAEK